MWSLLRRITRCPVSLRHSSVPSRIPGPREGRATAGLRTRNAALSSLFLVAFFSFLRKSNLIAPTATSFDPRRHLIRGDIRFTPTGAVLRIKWSKTRQHKEGLLLVPLPSIPGSHLCPVSALRHYFTTVPAPAEAPFFCLPKGQLLHPLTSAVFSASLKRVISHLGMDPRDYSPHSFRRGGATFAYQSGVPDHLIQLHGDWRSDAYQAYISLPLSTRSQVADIMASGLVSPAATYKIVSVFMGVVA